MKQWILFLLMFCASICSAQIDTVKPMVKMLIPIQGAEYATQVPFAAVVEEKRLLDFSVVVDDTVIYWWTGRVSGFPSFVNYIYGYNSKSYYTFVGAIGDALWREGTHKISCVASDSSNNITVVSAYVTFKKGCDPISIVDTKYAIENRYYVDTTMTFPRNAIKLPPGSFPVARTYSTTTGKTTIYFLKPKQ